MDVATSFDKRLVLIYTQGEYKGLRQVIGTESQLKESLKVDTLPAFVDPTQFLDHEGACSLVRVYSRYVVYREVLGPAISNTIATFHPSQQ